jgi:hypothetical protein
MLEHYEHRDDGLLYRSVTMHRSEEEPLHHYALPSPELARELPLRSMTEKFERHPDVPANSDIRRRKFYLNQKRIAIDFHYAEGRLTHASRVYDLRAGSQATELTNLDPFAEPVLPSVVDAGFKAAQLAEKECFGAVRTSLRETERILATRSGEEGNPTTEKSVFETARERAKADGGTAGREEAAEESVKKVDYLTPFLQGVRDPARLMRDEAERVRTECLKAMKKRLLDRADIIERRLVKEQAALAKKQATFQRNRDHMEGADEEFEAFCKEAMFRIQILEQRLQRHEEAALLKYEELNNKLKGDPRLAVLNPLMRP